jgi:hypothetical protein
MLTVVRHRWDRIRHLRMSLKQVPAGTEGTQATHTPVGAFAALLVEWKLAQQKTDETEDDQPTLKSA